MRKRGIEMACFLYNMMKYMESGVIKKQINDRKNFRKALWQ